MQYYQALVVMYKLRESIHGEEAEEEMGRENLDTIMAGDEDPAGDLYGGRSNLRTMLAEAAVELGDQR
jgi:hypothetical protein